MTRTDFIDDVTTPYDLIDFCVENDITDFINDIVDDDEKDSRIDEYLRENAGGRDNWREVYDILDNVPTGYEYYRYNGEDDIRIFESSDFEDLKDEVLQYCDTHDIFDEDEDDTDEYGDSELYVDEDDEEIDPEDMFSDPDTDDDFLSFIDASLETTSVVASCGYNQEEPLESLLF